MIDPEVIILWKCAKGRWSSKFQMMLAYAFFRGLRIGEICPINILDFQDDYTKLRVIFEKSHIEDVLPLIPELTAMTKDYILRNKHTFKDGYLFPFYSSKRLSPCMNTSTAEALFSKLRKIIGLEYPQFLEKATEKRYRIGWHSCRRWFETRIHDKVNDRKKLADIMRYLEVSTVDTYIDPYETWKKEGDILRGVFDERIAILSQSNKGQLRLPSFMPG
jgi:integrase